ncbi:MAG: IS21 family transposase, partial [Oscillospiraceae bacterium]
MVITVEIYKEVRRMHLDGVSQRQIATRLCISRNTVRKYLDGNVVPWERKATARPATVLRPEVLTFIENCLETDRREGTKKQHHTAKRIYDRLVAEQKFQGGESTIRAYVRTLREKTREAFVPLAFQPGDAVQIDWGEATIWLDGQRLTVNLFCARLCHSDAPFVVAYRRQNSESFLDALVQTFAYFGGVPRRVIFDNAKVAVKDGFGAHAKAQESYAALAAHDGFEAVFCNPASGNEKGLVEGLVGFSRRNFCVPMPRVGCMEELNGLLKERCQAYLTHTVAGKKADVGTLFLEEQSRLFPLPGYPYDPAKRAEARVTPFSTARYDTNSYSVPVKFCGSIVSIKALPERIEFYAHGDLIAAHNRCFGRQQNIYQMAHYLPLLERKGRAIFQAKPVRDNVPEYFLDWLTRQALKPKELVALLERSLEIGVDAVMRGEV